MTDGYPREARVYLQHKACHRVPVVVKTIPMMNENNEITGEVEIFIDMERKVKLPSDLSKRNGKNQVTFG